MVTDQEWAVGEVKHSSMLLALPSKTFFLPGAAAVASCSGRSVLLAGPAARVVKAKQGAKGLQGKDTL